MKSLLLKNFLNINPISSSIFLACCPICCKNRPRCALVGFLCLLAISFSLFFWVFRGMAGRIVCNAIILHSFFVAMSFLFCIFRQIRPRKNKNRSGGFSSRSGCVLVIRKSFLSLRQTRLSRRVLRPQKSPQSRVFG